MPIVPKEASIIRILKFNLSQQPIITLIIENFSIRTAVRNNAL